MKYIRDLSDLFFEDSEGACYSYLHVVSFRRMPKSKGLLRTIVNISDGTQVDLVGEQAEAFERKMDLDMLVHTEDRTY